jgi:SpoVK/Ycf46/Vps4 family AAA+-type ATPase
MEDIDAAFLRRMPKRFAIGLPDAKQRESILRLVGVFSFLLFDVING